MRMNKEGRELLKRQYAEILDTDAGRVVFGHILTMLGTFEQLGHTGDTAFNLWQTGRHDAGVYIAETLSNLDLIYPALCVRDFKDFEERNGGTNGYDGNNEYNDNDG